MPYQQTVLIMAGGTGGHVFPALAVANALREKGYQIVWLGTAAGLEAHVVPNAGIPLFCLTIKGLRGKSWRQQLLIPWQLLHSVWQAWGYIRQVKPDLIIGFGGYASGPGGLAAWLAHKPLVIHEQNARAGLTNRLLGKLAKQVLQAFPDTFPASYQAVTTGNPIRSSLTYLTAPTQRYNPHAPARLLILGGSLGATAINSLVPAALAQLPAELRPDVWHQTGSQHTATCLAHYQAAGLTATQDTAASAGIKICAFIEDMRAAYLWADLVICRAGALTIAELAAVGAASILIPFPHAVDDHQTYNAKFLVDAEAAILCPQASLNSAMLANLLQQYFSQPQQLLVMATRAYNLGNSEATAQVVNYCLAAL